MGIVIGVFGGAYGMQIIYGTKMGLGSYSTEIDQ